MLPHSPGCLEVNARKVKFGILVRTTFTRLCIGLCPLPKRVASPPPALANATRVAPSSVGGARKRYGPHFINAKQRLTFYALPGALRKLRQNRGEKVLRHGPPGSHHL